MSPATPQTVRFGLFKANLATGELFKAGRKIDLERQPFLVLSVLLRCPGDLVTREELQAALWPTGSFGDFNSGLNVAVKKLRDALGDSSENPRFIETLSRRGYRFIAPAEWVQNSTAEQTALHESAPSRVWLWCCVSVIAALATVGLSYWRSAARGAVVGVSELKPVPLTSSLGDERSPALSPDGTRVAYSWNGERRDNSDIYVKFIGSANPLRLTTDPASDEMPMWSPDGQNIAFVQTRKVVPQQSTIRVISALGGPDRELVELAPGECYRYGSLSWSPDGEWLAFADKPSGGDPYALYMVSLQTGETRKLTSPVGAPYGDAIPTFSPDGRTLAFARLTDYSAGDIYVMPVEGKHPNRVTHDRAGIFGLSWTADGKELVFSSERAGDARLWRIAASGGTPRPVLGITGSDLPRGVAQKANKLIFSREFSDQNIWRVGVDGPKMTRAPEQISGSTRDDTNPQPSPDGNRIAFASNRSGSMEIWVADPDGRNSMPLTSFGRGVNAWPTWSPDARFVAFNSNISGTWRIYVVDARGGQPRTLSSQVAFEAAPNWSPDGKWIYFESNRNGVMQIWKMPASGGLAIQLTKRGGWWPAISQDGKFVYYAQGQEIWRVPATGGEENRILGDVPEAEMAHWVPASGGLYFLSHEKTRAALKFFDFHTGRISEIMPVEKQWDLAPVAAFRDGKSLLFAQIDHGGTDLMLVENFH